MKRGLIIALKWIGGLLLTVILLLAAAVGVFNSGYFQDWVLQKTVVLLQDKLQTRVTVDELRIDLVGLDAHLYGLEVEDRQQRKMLRLDELRADVVLWQLMQHRVKIAEATCRGLEATLVQPQDTAANFQFIVDAFKRDHQHTDTVPKKKQKMNISLDVDKVELESIKFSYNDAKAELARLIYKKGVNDRQVAELLNLRMQWIHQSKKHGPILNKLRVGVLDMVDMQRYIQLSIDSLCYFTDNHKDRKNVGKPKRGAFDAGHFDVVAKLGARVEHLSKDSVVAAITNCQATDRGSGLNLTTLTCRLTANKRTLNLKNMTVGMAHTKLKIADAVVQLPSKKEGRTMAYHTSLITGTTQLRDISKPFAPVLGKFTLPLVLQTRMSGEADAMRFRDVQVKTADGKFKVRAVGGITGLKDKYQLHVHFDINKMVAVGDSKQRIINQFQVKKFMMKQLDNLGRIEYTGHFDVLYKREQFAGTLRTGVGSIIFNFALDEKNKYVFGKARTDSLELGKAMDMPDIGKTACEATFKFDISKPRTALMRRKKGGKLPIGEVKAHVTEARYKFIKVKNIDVSMVSDGAVAEGDLSAPGKLVDLSCTFSFTNTNEMKKMKVKPRVKFNLFRKSTDEEKERKRQLKEQKKEERRKQKAEAEKVKEAEKAAKKAEKEARKAAKEAEKAEKKAAKAAEKAARKAAKEAEKAAKKAAKEAAS